MRPADHVDVCDLTVLVRLAHLPLSSSRRLWNSQTLLSADAPRFHITRVAFAEAPFTVGMRRAAILAFVLLIIVGVVVIPVVVVIVVVLMVMRVIVVAVVSVAVPSVSLVPVVNAVRGKAGAIAKG